MALHHVNVISPLKQGVVSFVRVLRRRLTGPRPLPWLRSLSQPDAAAIIKHLS